ncbi:MAG: hypothetical protein AB7I50_15735 [Vicinamibacterales bacterium]
MSFTRLHITVFLAVAAAVWGLLLWAEGNPPTWQHLAPFGTAVSILAILALVLEKVAWHWKWLHWFVHRPDLRGTWRVEIQSSWIDPNTNQPLPVIEGCMAVTQSLSHLQMHQLTRESESWLVADRVVLSEKNTGYRIAAVYTNQPQLVLRGVRSEVHLGAFMLDTHGPTPSRPETITGEYWTDRKTTGTLVLRDRVSVVYSRFEDAAAAFRNR